MKSDGKAIRKYVSRKVSKVRWCTTQHSVFGKTAETFVFGGYDDENNQLGLCQLSSDDDDYGELALVSTLRHSGDVTEIKFFKDDHFVCSSSLGDVGYYEVSINEKPQLTERFRWNTLHYLSANNTPSSCTAVDVMEDILLTVGEDGKLNVLSLQELSEKPVRVIEADGSSLLCVCALKLNECVTGSLRGQIKLWDLRQDRQTPISTLYLTKTDDHVGPYGYADTYFPSATCFVKHPTQSHVLLSGDESGIVTVWDLRNTSLPTCILDSHKTTVTEAHFHPRNPDHLFTCSAGGDLWQWDCSYPTILNPFDSDRISKDTIPWIALANSKHRPNLSSLMVMLHVPINTLDVSSSTVICGADDEAIYVCTNVDVTPK